ncbi:hypothetical protein [Oceanicola sp. D3]|uniref:hypothetical protein n=1 Tax=Oceanicola sp. D3 TaxID=2587163 RepID=UPI00143E012B|nr:hypothetical protein [Oceanicola sp. D3]
MQQMKPETFAQLMRLPVLLRADLLEFIGSTPVADGQILSLIEKLAAGESPGVGHAA